MEASFAVSLLRSARSIFLSEVNLWAKVVVPTINSARWIQPIVRAYKEAHVEPLFLVDERSTDGTSAAIGLAGGHSISVNLPAPRVEALVPEIRQFVPPGWVFRVDDDEFPSADSFAWLRGPEPDASLDSIAIQRRWIRRSAAGQLQRAHCRLWKDNTGDLGGDHQWRIFHTERVKYVTDIHTPGFIPNCWEKAPEKAFLVHFDWLLRSEAERIAKMARYDQQHANSGAGNWHYYLHERIPPGDVSWIELETTEFNRLINEIAPIGRNSVG